MVGEFMKFANEMGVDATVNISDHGEAGLCCDKDAVRPYFLSGSDLEP